MKRPLWLILLAIGLFLAACSMVRPSSLSQVAAKPTANPPTQLPTETTPASAVQPALSVSEPVLLLAEIIDNQGAVTMIVKPLDLNNSPDTLNFEIALDTHSVDLSMDLAALATLTTDTGQSVQATLWDAPLGGHHVSGTLSFPASVESKPILDGASKLTLIIKDVDAPERIFTWSLR